MADLQAQVQRAAAAYEPGEGGERERESGLMTEHGLFEIVLESEVRGTTVSAAWLDEFGKACVRSRLVAKEFNTYQRDDVILNTPPL